MLVQFGNNWIQKIPLTAKLDSACGLVQFWLSSELFSSNYFQIGQHVVLLHILTLPINTIEELLQLKKSCVLVLTISRAYSCYPLMPHWDTFLWAQLIAIIDVPFDIKLLIDPGTIPR